MADNAQAPPRQLVLNHQDAHLEKRFLWALGLTCLVLVGEVAGGFWTNSLALLSDAAHVLMDVVALGLSYIALRMAAQAPSDTHSYGLHRAEVLAAVINGGTLFAIAAGIFWEAGLRLRHPEPVKSVEMLGIAAAGLALNLVVLLVLRGHSHEQDHDHDEGDLNVRSAWLHVLGDTLSSVGVIVAGLVIWRTGWTLLDPAMSVAIGGVLFFGAGRLLKSGIHILMEGVPEGLQLPQIGQAIAAVPGVRDVHDLHVWSLCPGSIALSAHVTVDGPSWEEVAAIQEVLKVVLRDRFRIEHTTIQLECAQCPQGVVASTDAAVADVTARL
ncbi:MAG: cation diffusion facilitator family transporter [Candidatus Methylomirabilales bacterium]